MPELLGENRLCKFVYLTNAFEKSDVLFDEEKKRMRNETARKKENTEKLVLLNPDLKSPRAKDFEDKLSSFIVGQERAVRRMSGLFQIYLACLATGFW